MGSYCCAGDKVSDVEAIQIYLPDPKCSSDESSEDHEGHVPEVPFTLKDAVSHPKPSVRPSSPESPSVAGRTSPVLLSPESLDNDTQQRTQQSTEQGTEQGTQQRTEQGTQQSTQQNTQQGSPTSFQTPSNPVSTAGVDASTDGAYLTYSSVKEGTFFTVWSTEPVSDAIAFCQRKPGIRVPKFKYRGKTEIISHIHTDKKYPLKGILLFLRSVKTFQCKIEIYDLQAVVASIPNITVFIHDGEKKTPIVFNKFHVYPSPQVLCLRHNAPPTQYTGVNTIAACYDTSPAVDVLSSLQHANTVPVAMFRKKCIDLEDHVETVSFNL